MPRKSRKVDAPEYTQRHIRVLSDDELKRMDAETKTPMERAVFHFLRSTGCRVSEMLNVKVKDLTFDRNLVLLRITKQKVIWHRVKRGEAPVYHTIMPSREAIIDKDAVEFIKNHIEDMIENDLEWMKTEEKDRAELLLFPITRRSVGFWVKRWAEAAKIADWKAIHPHTFRHTEATRLLRNNVDSHHIHRVLGWSPGSNLLDTVYGHVTPDDEARIILKSREKKKDDE